MQTIELRGKTHPSPKGHYFYYALALLGLINLVKLPLGALLWIAVWGTVGFCIQRSIKTQVAKFKIVIDDNGITFTDWMGVHSFQWTDLSVDEVSTYSFRNSVVGRSVRSHGGDPALAVKKTSGMQSGSINTYLLFKSSKQEYTLPRLLSDEDYLDLISILNIVVASKSKSKITQSTVTVQRVKDAVKLVKEEGKHASAIELVAKTVAEERQKSSGLGFSRLPGLQKYLDLLEQQHDEGRATAIRTEIESILSRIK